MSDENRRWFTMTEVTVCTVTIGLLTWLLMPVVYDEHQPSRLRTCQNNLRQLGLAQLNRVYAHNGAFGGYLEPLKIAADNPMADEDLTTPETRELMVAWPTRLLPSLDSTALYEQILASNDNPGFSYDAPPRMEIFLCPSDTHLDPAAAGLSYVVNSGMPDLVEANENEPSDLRANGVCHDQRPGRFGPQVGWQHLKDGANTTILLSESIHRDPPGTAQRPGNNWLRPAPDATNPEQWYGMTWLVDEMNPRTPRAELMERFNKDSRSEEERDEPYAARGARFARPASNHPELFIAAFCEGNAREIRETIDYAVYQQLMTPDGRKAAPANATEQPFEKTLPDDQRFMNSPLTDGDY